MPSDARVGGSIWYCELVLNVKMCQPLSRTVKWNIEVEYYHGDREDIDILSLAFLCVSHLISPGLSWTSAGTRAGGRVDASRAPP